MSWVIKALINELRIGGPKDMLGRNASILSGHDFIYQCSGKSNTYRKYLNSYRAYRCKLCASYIEIQSGYDKRPMIFGIVGSCEEAIMRKVLG